MARINNSPDLSRGYNMDKTILSTINYYSLSMSFFWGQYSNTAIRRTVWGGLWLWTRLSSVVGVTNGGSSPHLQCYVFLQRKYAIINCVLRRHNNREFKSCYMHACTHASNIFSCTAHSKFEVMESSILSEPCDHLRIEVAIIHHSSFSRRLCW